MFIDDAGSQGLLLIGADQVYSRASLLGFSKSEICASEHLSTKMDQSSQER
jgi:hypothetical protein